MNILNMNNVHQHITNNLTCLNITVETWIYPDELKSGLLTPLQTTGKQKGPTGNLIPVILLSMFLHLTRF